jgi:aryl-alcohol dehydrogenase-like predicted oxidoreductase
MNKLMLGGNVFGHFTNSMQTDLILKRAFYIGIKAVDTADVYTDGVSEELIGAAISGNRSSWFIATKVGLRSGENPSGLGRKDNILKRIEASLRRLKTDYIDLYQLHHYDPSTPIEETIDVFVDLKQRGLIRYAGLSNFNPSQLCIIQSSKQHVFTHHQILMNITKPTISSTALNQTRNVAYSVLHRGLLSDKYLGKNVPINSRAIIIKSIQKDLNPQFIERLHRAAMLCHNHGTSITAVAIQWVFQQPMIDWAIVGCRSILQLDELKKYSTEFITPEVILKCEKIFQETDP